MKKTIALLLVLCLLLPFCYAAAAEETGETDRSAPTLYDFRYYFEHKLLPNELYNYADQLIPFLRERGAFLLWQNFTLNNNADVFYAESDFSVRDIPRENGDTLLMLTLPKPEKTPLCARVYLYRSADGAGIGYYTVEYDDFFGESWFLCSWTKEGTHLNHGDVAALPDPADPGYEEALSKEIGTVWQLIVP